MKNYVNLFYTILEQVEKWKTIDSLKKLKIIANLMNIKEDNDLFVVYFDKYEEFLLNNTLKIFTKDILDIKF